MASIAFAAQPVQLTDTQMDKVTAGPCLTAIEQFVTPCCSFCFSTTGFVAVIGYRLVEN
jgi:hypothetical protein